MPPGKNYDLDLTEAQRSAILVARQALVAGTATTTQKDLLLREVLSLLIDTPQITADAREFSRGFDESGQPNSPEYRHELLMEDRRYRRAWLYDVLESYRVEADADPELMLQITAARTAFPYREMAPDIVWRSLLRNGYREAEEGEKIPPNPMGRYAPASSIVLPSVPRTEAVIGIE